MKTSGRSFKLGLGTGGRRVVLRSAMAGLLTLAGISAADPVAAAPPPIVYAQKTRGYEVELRMDPALKRYGGLYVGYRDDVLRSFNAFEREADQLSAFQPASAAPNPLVDRVEIVVTCITPHLIGVIQRSFQDRHGQHPVYGIQGHILDRASGRRLGASDLLKPGTDLAPLDAALQAAVDVARHARHGDQPVPLPPASSLPTWDAERPTIDPRNHPPSDATLAAAGSGAVAGGLQFLYAPYDVGRYSDGGYRVVLPLSVFASALRPQYSRDFAEAPAPLPDDPLQDSPTE